MRRRGIALRSFRDDSVTEKKRCRLIAANSINCNFSSAALGVFKPKWLPVRVRKTHQNKKAASVLMQDRGYRKGI